MNTWSRRRSSTTIADADARPDEVAAARVEPRSRSLERRDRRGDRALADLVGPLHGGCRRAALAEQEVALRHTDVGPHQRGVLSGRRRRVGDGLEPSDRLAGPAGVACDLGERHLEPHPRARRVRREGTLGGRLEQLSCFCVAPGVGERVRLVEEVHGDATSGEPPGQVGVVDGRLARQRGRLVAATEADEARCPRRRQLDARLRRVRLTRRSRRSATPRPVVRRRRAARPAGRRRPRSASGSVRRRRAASWAASAPSRSRRPEKRVVARRCDRFAR